MKHGKILIISSIFLIVIISLVVVVFFCFILPNSNFFSENSSFYFFSSLLQANAAILSIVGVFFIFRIQSLQSAVDIIKASLMSDRGHSCQPAEIIKWDNYSIEEKESQLKKGTTSSSIRLSLQDWTSKERHIINLKKGIKLPSILLGVGIVLESMSLFSANYLHKYTPGFEYYISYINLVLELFIVFVVIKSIIDILK
ncbi:MAG: hypothetical protein MUP49_04740 [Dehalococcoidia bacterium]|nr:hypothetical protein [Dehalococcoidia bacterium]